MRDGTRIALDVHLPREPVRGTTRRLATILHQTRYHRGVELRFPFDRFAVERRLDNVAEMRQRFLAAGYAWVDVCARGSGASLGHRPCPWSPDEVADGAEVVEWIVRQRWSSGVVGATGVSYDGTAAELLLANRHPAVRAVAPRFCLFDVYADVAFPGGIHLTWFTEQWGRFNRALDANALGRAVAQGIRHQTKALRQRRWLRRLELLDRLLEVADHDALGALSERLVEAVATGVRPVDGDDGRLLAAAVAAHRDNFDVHQAALGIEYRDEPRLSSELPGETIDLFSPHTYRAELASSDAAVYGFSGWYDGGYPHAAVKRFGAVRTAGSRMILGPWDHGGGGFISPYGRRGAAAFDHAEELIRFFDEHLRGIDRGRSARAPVRYFTIGEERWKEASEWPPPGTAPVSWYLASDRRLRLEPSAEAAVDEYRVDPDVGTGHRARWNSLLVLMMPVDYTDRAAVGKRLLVYRSAPLREAVEVTGHPIVTVTVSADTQDLSLFAYLEDEHPDGWVDYVTEGQLRALHRRISPRPRPYPSPTPYHSFERCDGAPLQPGEPAELCFDLQPVSWRLPAGHRIRLAFAGADRDHFAPPDEVPTLAFWRGGPHRSRLELPTTRGRSSSSRHWPAG